VGSVQLSYYAAKAAALFRPTRSRDEAHKTLPSLRQYFDLIRQHGRERFDTIKLAALELDWWQLRRENAGPVRYADVIAQTTAELYQLNKPEIQQAASVRAEMMDYRDRRHDGKMRPEDWAHIKQGLRRSYSLLKNGVANPAVISASRLVGELRPRRRASVPSVLSRKRVS
jgi:hypothetical protein